MERGSNLHTPRVDEELQDEVQSLITGAPVEARAEEGREKEGPADDEPTPESVIAEIGEGTPTSLSHTEVVARSELARHLRPSIFPADRAAIVACAADEHAPPDLVAQIEAIDDETYANVQQVWEAMGGRREERTHHAEEPAEPAEVPAPAAVLTAPVEPSERARQPASPLRRSQRFGFRFSPVYALAGASFGITPLTAHVTVGDRDGELWLSARFGIWSVATPLRNVASVEQSGPYRWFKTIGPPRVSFRDRGLTFATNASEGLCIRFHDPVRGIDVLGLVKHRALTVTVDDVSGLEAAL
ncbi:MAG: DUF2795 domain-containing protein [Actinobacteria bacterium]|nr:MAG: DUF2795 domain-containing protein [Actinomycetota bacterium]